MKLLILWAGLVVAGAAGAQNVQVRTSNDSHKAYAGKVPAKTKKSYSNRPMYFNKKTNYLPSGNYSNNPSGVQLNVNRYNISRPDSRMFDASSTYTIGTKTELNGTVITDTKNATQGISKGHFTTRPGGATTSGSITGSGATGTGTSPGVMGSSGARMGVDGLSPNAGNKSPNSILTKPAVRQ